MISLRVIRNDKKTRLLKILLFYYHVHSTITLKPTTSK